MKKLTIHKLKDYYMLTYPYTHLIVVSFLLSAAWIGMHFIYINFKLIIALILSILWVSQINVLNNIHDIMSDMIHDFEKPLVKGTLSIKQAYFFWAVLYGASLLVSFFINLIAITISILVPLLAVAYSGSPKLKRWTPLAHTIMAVGYGVLLFILGWSLNNPIKEIPYYLLLIFFLMSTLITISKDYKDIKEDLSVGIITLPAYSLKLAYTFQCVYSIFVYLLVLIFIYLNYLPRSVLLFLPTISMFLVTLCYIVKQKTPEGYAKGYLFSIISGCIAILVFSISFLTQ